MKTETTGCLKDFKKAVVFCGVVLNITHIPDLLVVTPADSHLSLSDLRIPKHPRTTAKNLKLT